MNNWDLNLVTEKANHGIGLDIWERALRGLGIEYKRYFYDHKRYTIEGMTTSKKLCLEW